MEESFLARADGGFDRVAKSAECEGDVRCRTAITAMAQYPAGTAGVRQDPEGVDNVGALAGAGDDCGSVEVSQSEKFWANMWAALLSIRLVL